LEHLGFDTVQKKITVAREVRYTGQSAVPKQEVDIARISKFSERTGNEKGPQTSCLGTDGFQPLIDLTHTKNAFRMSRIEVAKASSSKQ